LHDPENIGRALDRCTDFACVFELVKRAVKERLGMSRAGLMLGLADLPLQVGAFHAVGGNFIVMNRQLLDRIVHAARSRRQINSYVFYILLHEYLHALGVLREQEVKRLAIEICESLLGEEHPATEMAAGGLGSIFRELPPLQHYQDGESGMRGFEIVKDFDRETDRFYV
jgi:hypothetical protein